MSINVTNPEAEALLAELQRRTGKGATDLLLDLLRREKERVEQQFRLKIEAAREDTRVMVERWNARPSVDPRPLEEVLAWDENGLPM